ncbi:MAG: hydroxymethylglutaryl-CoA lyase [Hyphomicrobiaceae bacterium]
MVDLPKRIIIHEEGPREGFQIEPGPIPTADKVALIEALSQTGVGHIQVCSFVSPRLVPGWSDADAVVAALAPKRGVAYTALWFNAPGLERALAHRDKLDLKGSISLSASEAFSRKNLNRDRRGQIEAMRQQTRLHLQSGVPVTRIGVMAAFGCNFAGDIPVAEVVRAIEDGFAIAAEAEASITEVSLADTMGWATPIAVDRVVGAVRERWPDAALRLHLHDTRGLGIANAYAGLRLGIARFDTTIGGLGGCPFAAHKGAPGNIATEELVLLADEMGIETGIDLEQLIAASHLAERIVGHPLPSAALRGGSLASFRARSRPPALR